jgi:hypothetical protein
MMMPTLTSLADQSIYGGSSAASTVMPKYWCCGPCRSSRLIKGQKRGGGGGGEVSQPNPRHCMATMVA